RLHLYEQLVDDPGDALARIAIDPAPIRVGGERVRRRRRTHAAARAGDRVDLLDETDRAAFFGRGLAQFLEVVPDLATRRAVVLRLERRGRHEQERNAGL